MKPTNVYAVRRADGWHCTVWFESGTMPAAHVVLVLGSLGELEAAAIAKYEQERKQ